MIAWLPTLCPLQASILTRSPRFPNSFLYTKKLDAASCCRSRLHTGASGLARLDVFFMRQAEEAPQDRAWGL